MPPVWNHRAPRLPKSSSQSMSPGLSCEAAEFPLSEQPSAPRKPNPRSVKLRPLRTFLPAPSALTHLTKSVLTPPCIMKSSIRYPTSFFARELARAARSPKHFLRPRATLYSPPPSHARKLRAVRMRSSPGSRRNMTSPRDTMSNCAADLSFARFSIFF